MRLDFVTTNILIKRGETEFVEKSATAFLPHFLSIYLSAKAIQVESEKRMKKKCFLISGIFKEMSTVMQRILLKMYKVSA